MTYKCSQCSKFFATAQGLQQHVALHAGVKPHLCDLCSKSFAQASTLQSHMRIHTGEQPYRCLLTMYKIFRSEIFTEGSYKKTHWRDKAT